MSYEGEKYCFFFNKRHPRLSSAHKCHSQISAVSKLLSFE